MTDSTTTTRDLILQSGLPDVVFDGWDIAVFRAAAQREGLDPMMVHAVFPDGLPDIIAHFSDWADRAMLDRLAPLTPETMKVRDRIRAAVLARFDVLSPWKEQVRMASTWWAVPGRQPGAMRCIWRSADRIWDWAGDIATDYNRYTKRTLLAGVLGSTTLSWLAQDGNDPASVASFVDRRIDNVMMLAKAFGRIVPGQKKDNNKRAQKGRTA